jgi:hypothetical protein
MRFLQFLVVALPAATTASVLRRSANSAAGLVERAALPPTGAQGGGTGGHVTTTKAATPTSVPTYPVTVDLSSLFNVNQATFDEVIHDGQHRTGAPQVSWQPYSTLGDNAKGRTTKEHANGDVAIRLAIPLSVNTAALCPADGGHAIWYIFPQINAGKLHMSVDSWNTLTDNNNACQNAANNQLKSWVGSQMLTVEGVINQWMPTRNNFVKWTILPSNYNDKLDVQITAATV